MIPLAAESALLAAAVRHAMVAPVEVDALPSLVAAVNWHHLLWLSRQQGSHVALHALFAGRAEALAPADALAQLAAARAVDQLRQLARAKELCDLQDRFDAAGLAVVWTGGWMFAQRHLARPALRDAGNQLSCVVEPAEVARAEALLRDAGYRLEDDPLRLAQLGRSRVVVRSRAAFAAVWPDAPGAVFAPESVSIGGRTLRTLSAAGWLLRLGLRARAGAALTSRSAGELVALLARSPALDWPAVSAQAEKLGLRPALLRRLAASYEILGVPPPAALADQLATLPPLDRRVALSAHDDTATDGPAPARDPALATTPDTELAYIGRFSPTPPLAVTAMLRLADTTTADIVYDLGCGDGRVVVTAAKDFGARATGVDIDPQRIAEANARAAQAGVGERARFLCADVLRTPIRDGTVVFVYLQGFAYPELRRKFAAELPPGTRILSHDFVFPDWPPEKTVIVRTGPLRVSHLYLWKL
ncbi:MAG: hypothetical protein RLZZ15_545 [Verrucomicrobiota bacterium]|jgi:predicted O-methyltransferase YrrM